MLTIQTHCCEAKKIEKTLIEQQIKGMQHGFDKMIEYCERLGCRHVAFSKYFGDTDLRACNTSCDHCKNPKICEEAVQKFNGEIWKDSTSMKWHKKPSLFDDSSELYEGGRCSNRFWDSEGGKYDHTKIETEEKKNVRKLLPANLCLDDRYQNYESSNASNLKDNPNIRLIDPQSKTVANVTMNRREAIYDAIYAALIANYYEDLNYTNLQKASSLIEHEIFKSSKNNITYQHKSSQKILEIKRSTKEQKKYELPELPNFSQNNFEGFKLASSLGK
ncbi:unnamed protein product [Dracunculus medinensis]|uniref:RecQ_Zn_bind domain-containing protein n=1 Tax=Dracunculus medinensis TaxID=318479 RepID=A0A0N4UF20_DRAME|nr:unnamed protein product [Dracunculus medinensis]